VNEGAEPNAIDADDVRLMAPITLTLVRPSGRRANDELLTGTDGSAAGGAGCTEIVNTAPVDPNEDAGEAIVPDTISCVAGNAI